MLHCIHTLALIALMVKIISGKYLMSVCMCVRRGMVVQVQRHVQQSKGAVERALQCFSAGGHCNGDVSRSSPVQLASGQGKGPALM